MAFDFAISAQPLLDPVQANVFFDGTFSAPRLSHPEGVAVGPDGWIWTGNEDGDICRIAPDGSRIERAAGTGGFILGLAFDGARALFACDMKHAAVFRFDLATGALERFSRPDINVPNFPLVDRARYRLLVSDSHPPHAPGPGIWALDLETGDGDLWYEGPLHFANGLAQRPGEDAVYVCETFAPAITRIPVHPDGSAGPAERFAANLPGLPDGIAFASDGSLVVGCYEPSRLLRIAPDGGTVQVLVEDVTAHTLCHPTNIAFDGDRLYAANLGRWHISVVDLGKLLAAPPLWSVQP